MSSAFEATSISSTEAGVRHQVGEGDNVFTAATNIVGRCIHVDDVDQVLQLMTDGVPAGSIALIDDSGGTLTAPILSDFVGVLCLGGTVRTHLAFISREYQLPCLMAANFAIDVADGDLLEIESSAPATSAESYHDGSQLRARIWRLAAG